MCGPQLPILKSWPDDRSVLVVDGASTHKMPEVRALVENAGAVLLHAPAYSPDLMLPVEGFFSKVKKYMQGAERQRLEAVRRPRAPARCVRACVHR